jgi:type VI secretion system protein ImpC
MEKRVMTFRIMAIADLAPGYDGGPMSVDRDSFESVLDRLGPQATVEAPDRIGSGKRSLACSFAFKTMGDFDPDDIVQAVPILRGLAEARNLLGQCLDRKVELSDIRPRIVEAFAGTDLSESIESSGVGAPSARVDDSPAGAERGESDVVEALLDQVDVPQAAAGGPQAADLVEMLTSLVAPAGPKLDREHLESLVREIDVRISRQVAAIQEEPQFEKLEATWRGLKFLVDRLEFRGPIRLDVLPAGRDDFLERFFEHVFHAEYEGTSELPLNIVLVDHAFGRSVPDLDAVRNMARFGESLSVPFVAAMDPSYWGVRQAGLITKLPDLAQKAQGSEYSKWTKFRSEPASMWVVLAANRFLLRPVWSETQRPPKQFTWTWQDGDERPVWGSAVWAMGSAVGQSFADAGIRFPCVGPGSPGALENLPVVVRSSRSGESHASSLEIDLEDERAFQLAQVGFSPLVSHAGSDTAFFNLVPSFHKPARYEDEEATRNSFLSATLPYRSFAGAVAHELDRLGRNIGGGVEPAKIVETVKASFLGILAPLEEGEQNEESVEVEVEPNPEEPGLLDVTVRLRPDFLVYGGNVDLIVGTSIPR